MKAILDASPIIAFFDELKEAGKLLLLQELDYELLIPDYIRRKEIVKEPSASVLARCIENGSISVLPPLEVAVVEEFQCRHPALDRGETEVIVNALMLQSLRVDAICILDEGPARQVAKRLGLHVMGTLGVLSKLRRAGLVDSEEETRLLRTLEASTFRIGKNL